MPTRPNETPDEGSHPGPLRLEMAPPKQVNLQFMDDTWERLLNSLERLEHVTEGSTLKSAGRLDRHSDKDAITETETEIRSEVHLQIKCLEKITQPLREDAGWIRLDFLSWFGGREPRKAGAVDEYALPVLMCVRGEAYSLPELPDLGPLTEAEMMRTMEGVGAGLHHSDAVEERFVDDPALTATRHLHARGTVAFGRARLARLCGQIEPDLLAWINDDAADATPDRTDIDAK